METENKHKENLKKVMTYTPLVLTMLFAVVFLGASVIALIYSAVTYLAFGSVMVFLILFGCSVLTLGIGTALVDKFISLKKKLDCKDVAPEKEEQKTAVVKKKFNVTMQTICFGIMIVGAVFIIVSAGLGVTSADKWDEATKDYVLSNGYYQDAKSFEVAYDSTNPDKPIDKIVFDLDGKNAVVIYTDDSFVTIKGYENFPAQLSVTYGGGTIVIHENPSPKKDGNLEKMLFFIFDENEVEAQIRIYLPKSLEGQVEFTGNYIVAQN